MGRPTNTQKVLKQLSDGAVQKQTPIATDMFLPNHSGDHSAGILLRTPTTDTDIANKKYVDDAVATADDYLLNTGDTASGNYTFDSPTFHIDSTNHRVGIGTTDPKGKLHVAGGTIVIDNNQFIRSRLQATGNVVNLFHFFTDDDLTMGSTLMNNMRFDVGGKADALFIENVTGYVGIGTETPTQKLDVHGNLNVSGIIYNARTSYYSIPASGFIAENPDVDDVAYFYSPAKVTITSAGTDMFTPVYLPHGATITSCIVNGTDDADEGWYLYKAAKLNGAATSIANDDIGTEDSGLSEVVDNSAYNYFVVALSMQSGHSIVGATISFTMP